MRNLLAFLCLFLSGCVWNHDYPDNWPALETVTGICPDIAGSYAEIGRTSGLVLFDIPFHENPDLSVELLHVQTTETKAITITQHDANSILVSAISFAGVLPFLHAFDFENGDFRCDESKIWFPSPMDGGLVGKWTNKTGFGKTTDGSLVAEEHSVDVNGKTVRHLLWPAYITDETATN